MLRASKKVGIMEIKRLKLISIVLLENDGQVVFSRRIWREDCTEEAMLGIIKESFPEAKSDGTVYIFNGWLTAEEVKIIFADQFGEEENDGLECVFDAIGAELVASDTDGKIDGN